LGQSRPTLLLTRPQAQAERFAGQCRKAIGEDLRVMLSPVVQIKPRDVTGDLSEFAGIALTSENGARILPQVANASGVTAWCVGDRTARVADALGMVASSAKGSATDLARMIIGAAPKGTVLHAHGARKAGDLVGQLQAVGINAQSLVIYDQAEQALTQEALAAMQAGPVILPLFSPYSASVVAKQIPGNVNKLAIVAISEAAANAWTGQRPGIFTVAKHPDAPHMVSEIATIWSDLSA